MTLYENGKALREEGKQVEAMQAFLGAVHSGTEDAGLLGRVYSNMANMCRQANDHEMAYVVYEMSAASFGRSGDTLAYAYALNNMAWEQAVMGNKELALVLVDSAVRCYPRPPLTEKIIETKAAACLFRQEYDSVLYYTEGAGNDYLLMLRAQAYSYLQRDDSATYYAQLLLPRMTNLFYLDDLYYILTHHDANADAAALRALSSERADVKKQIAERHGELTKAVQLLKQDLEREEDSVSWAFVVLVLVGIGLLVLGAFVVYKQRKLRTEMSAFEQARRREFAQNVRQLQESADIRQELGWEDYAAVCREIDKRFHGLASDLQAKNMSEQDVRLCALVLIGLSHKEMADMLNCSPKSIGKLKDITARKLGVSGGGLQEKLQRLAV